MATLGLESVELVSTLRTVAKKGAPSSDDFNDSQKESLADLTALASFLNDVVLPLLNALPEGALLPVEAPVGIEGRTLYSDTGDSNSLFYDSLASTPLTVADSLRLLNGMVEGFRTSLEDMGIRVSALQTRLSSDNKNDLSLALQNLTNTINTVTNTQDSQASLMSELEDRLDKLRSKRTTTGSVPAGSQGVVAVTWGTPYIDNNYTVTSLAMEELTGQLRVLGFVYQLNGAGVNVLVENTSISDALTGTIHASAKYDPEV
jgi:hypothetical protein